MTVKHLLKFHSKSRVKIGVGVIVRNKLHPFSGVGSLHSLQVGKVCPISNIPPNAAETYRTQPVYFA